MESNPSRSSLDRLRAAGTVLALSALLVTGTANAADEAAQGQADEYAASVAAAALDAMGGADAWAATRFLRFDFFGFRLHHWDRWAGRHRLEGKTRDGNAYVVLTDLNQRDGRAWLDGQELDGEAKAEWLERAWGAWINDTYWLLMPTKLRDPGVTLRYEGSEEIDGVACEKLKLTFASVGLTPGDTYWAWFDADTHLMRRWAYHLEDWPAEQAATAWDWLDWQQVGQVKMSPLRRKVDDGTERSLGQLAVFDQLPDAVFTSPEPVPAE